MRFDPEQHPEAARCLTALLATGEYVEALTSCPDCQGGVTALVRRHLLGNVGATCLFCQSPRVAVTALDPLDTPQLT